MSARLHLTDAGWLSPYALAKGYEERVEWSFGSVRLYLANGSYHVASSATAEHRPFQDIHKARLYFLGVVEGVELALSARRERERSVPAAMLPTIRFKGRHARPHRTDFPLGA